MTFRGRLHLMQFAPETACAVKLAAEFAGMDVATPLDSVREKDGLYLLPAAQVTLRAGSVL